jgi:hypothetical protein
MGKSFWRKSRARNRFDLFDFPNGPHSGNMLPRNANFRTQRGRLAHVLIDQTMSET